MALTFTGQILIIVAAATDQTIVVQNRLAYSGIAFTVASFGTSIATTLMTVKARIDLGKLRGSIGVAIGPNGIGAVYKFPNGK
jgi:hypothetical protein